MNSPKKIIISLIFIFAIGVFAGYYYGSKKQTSNHQEIIYKSNNGEKTVDTEKIIQKIDLLKSYTDLIMLPPEKIADPKKYADEMVKKLESINDNDLTVKYYATGETDNKEQKIIDFLDFLNESIKADLQ